MIKSKLIYLAFSALLLIGCSGVTSNVILQLQPDKDYKFNYSLSPAPQVEVPDEVLGTMRNEIQKGLSEQNLLASKGDDKFYKADVLITHYRMRPDAARLLVGIMAGCDKINSKLTIVDSNTTKTIGQAEFESNECAAWGVASQVIKAHIKKIVDYLSSLSADSPLSAPVSVTAPELVTKATPEQGETIKPGGINTDGRFIAYGDGTVLDTKTNLMWAAKDNRADVTWQEAKNYCENYRGGGYTDWRMPMQNELAGLYNKYKPRPMACDTSYTNRLETALIDISCYYLWASETESSFFRSTSACFSFFDGQRAFFRQSYNGYMRVLPVRSVKDVSKSILKSDGSPYIKAGSTTQMVPQAERDKVIAYAPKEHVSESKVTSLRSKPDGNFSQSHYQALLRKYDFFDNTLNKNGSFQNDFVDNGNGTITDRSTGLMWQKSGSSRELYLVKTEDYIKKLNRDGFAGYSDWRIPTTDEIVSLLKQAKKSWRDLHIDPLFDKTQYSCWSSDVGISNISTGHYNAWFVSFEEGTAKQMRTRDSDQEGQKCNPELQSISRYVRAVRSVQQSNP